MGDESSEPVKAGREIEEQQTKEKNEEITSFLNILTSQHHESAESIGQDCRSADYLGVTFQ